MQRFSIPTLDKLEAQKFFIRNCDGLVNICLMYIKQCRYQLDVYEYFISLGIGQTNAKFLSSFAEFLETEGDPFTDGP